MPTGPWATSEQLEWLAGQRVGFAQAQQLKKLPGFWVDVNRDFFTRWPDPASEIKPVVEASTSNGKKKKKNESVLSPLTTTAWVELRKKVRMDPVDIIKY